MSEEITFKGGDRITHPAIGDGTVAGRKGKVAELGPNGELKVKPDEEHHSGEALVEVMARRCSLLDPPEPEPA